MTARCPNLLPLLPALVLFPLTAGRAAGEPDLSRLPPPAAEAADFTRDIRPLLTTHCVKCHGPEKQKGGLRLDNKSAAFRGGDDGPVLTPDRSSASVLIHRVSSLDPDDLMPPEGERLTDADIGKLRAWIDRGATWPDDGPAVRLRSDHWAFQPLTLPDVPGNAPDAVDAFIRAGLEREGLTLSPEADRRTLIRRLRFDLTGLPPSPEETAAFVSDPSPHAWENLVERLLASPEYGERWGRHWLDAARYTESQGFEYDRLRDNAWHYRDYVIRSFNEDKPYDQFMQEQIAGDVREPLTRDGLIAPSLLVCGPWDQAGNSQSNATQRAITREDELEDMIGVVGQTFLGLTLNCARCHAHKYDPVPQEEYYRIKSVFEGVKHGERPLTLPDEEKIRQEQLATLQEKADAARKVVAAIEQAGRTAAAAHLPDTHPEPGPAPLISWTFDGTPPGLAGYLHGGARQENGTLLLPADGAFYQSAPLPRDITAKTLEVWISLDRLDQRGGAAISLETADGSRFDAITFGERQPRQWAAGSEGFRRTHDLATPPEDSAPGTLLHIAAVYREDNSISLYRNGEPRGERYTPAVPLQRFVAGDARILLGRRHTGGGNPWLTGAIRQAALYDHALSDEEIATLFRASGSGIPREAMLAALTEEQRTTRGSALATATAADQEIAAIRARRDEVSYAGTRVQPPPTHFLARGDVTAPGAVVAPGTLSVIAALDPDFGLLPDAPEAERRRHFAAWLADPRNPLPARVMANRVWHLHFGQGIVSSPNDLGAAGSRPTHPALLDWLAVRFIRSGWSVKALHRLIVHSATYRQSSAVNPQAMTVDADNQWLWRYAPRRLEAEAIRDSMLAVSGQLNPQAGGPGFRPFTISEYGAAFYHLEDRTGPEYNRRTVYRINVNSGKDALLDAFDCPDPSVKTPRRGVTTTPLQALELMNNSFVQRQARHFAERAMAGAPDDLPAAVQRAWQLALGRDPSPDETRRATAAARERGLVSVCWALLNSTGFVYVD